MLSSDSQCHKKEEKEEMKKKEKKKEKSLCPDRHRITPD